MHSLAKSAGFTRENEHHDEVPEADRRRPLCMAWITDELIDETRKVWSPEYGRVLSADEAVEILMNVKRLAEMLMKIQRERNDG
jgi:hypothetical protein